MKTLKLLSGQKLMDVLKAEDGWTRNSRRAVRLSVGYTGLGRWFGIYLRHASARKLRDWLDGWLKEQEAKR